MCPPPKPLHGRQFTVQGFRDRWQGVQTVRRCRSRNRSGGVAIPDLYLSTGMKNPCACGNPSLSDRICCAECRNRAFRDRYANDPEFKQKKRDIANRTFTAEKRRAYWAVLKAQALAVLGGPQCRTCGFSDARALQIDHVDGLGHLRRREHAETGRNLYNKVIQCKGAGYQILCANCNWIKRCVEGNQGGPSTPTPCVDADPKTDPGR